MKFTEGEIVDISIKGARVEPSGSNHYQFKVGASDLYVSNGLLGAHGVTVSRRAPAEWPPQPGDVWDDAHDGSWWARDFEGKVQLQGGRGGTTAADYVLREYGPLTLAYRKGWSPAPAADVDQADEPEDDRRAAAAALLRHIADGIDAGLHVPYTVENLDVGLFGKGASSNPDAAIAWTTHLDPTGQTVVDVDRSSMVAKLDWRGCKVKVWTPAPKPEAPAIDIGVGAAISTVLPEPREGQQWRRRSDDGVIHLGPASHGNGWDYTDMGEPERVNMFWISTRNLLDGFTLLTTVQGGPVERYDNPATGDAAPLTCDEADAASIAATDPAELEPGTETTWLFSFGSGQRYDGCYVLIDGTYDDARDEMMAHFGNAWSFQYQVNSRGADEVMNEYVELPRHQWPPRNEDADGDLIANPGFEAEYWTEDADGDPTFPASGSGLAR